MIGRTARRRDGRRRRGRRLAAPLLGLVLGVQAIVACAPVVKPPGPPAGKPEMTDAYFEMADGARLPLRSWVPEGEPKAAVLAVHGFNDYSLFFRDFGVFLAENGVISYAYDQRGFGESLNTGFWAGADAYPHDVRTVADLIRDRHQGMPFFVFGESMGGAVTMVAAAEPPGLDADGLVLSAPAVWARETMPFYQRWVLGLGAWTLPWLRLSGKGLDIKPSDNIDMLIEWGRDPLVIKETRIDTIYGLVNLMDRALVASDGLPPNTLILYGATDEVIRRGPTLEMMRRLDAGSGTRPRVALYENGYHMLTRDLSAEIVWRDVLAWIENSAEPLPSGAEAAGAAFVAEARSQQGD